MADNTITVLPREIIEYILEDRHIDIVDIVNLSFTCKHLHKIVNSNNKLWKAKFFQRWPRLKGVYEEIGRFNGNAINWKHEVEACLIVKRKAMQLLSLMSSKNYWKLELCSSDLQEFDALVNLEEGAHSAAYHFLVDELISVINQPVASCNLTDRYYAFKVIRHIKQNYLKEAWEEFIKLPPKEQLLDYAATLVAQWSQPERYVSYLQISNILDNFANQAKEVLREQYPEHPIFAVPQEQFNYWKHNNIDDNQWSVTESKQVMDALCTVLFHKLGFHGNSDMYYSSENSFIDRVLQLRRGIPITLAIVFESVARRLGIRCDPVSFPSHFLLRWKESYTLPESMNAESFYIDVFDGGRFLTKKNCPRIGGVQRCPIEKYNVLEPATAVEVVKRIANNLEVAVRQHTHLNGRVTRLRSAIELQHMINPSDINTMLRLGRFYVIHRIDSSDLVNKLINLQQNMDTVEGGDANIVSHILRSLQQLRPKKDLKPRQRTLNVHFAVGLIMKHKTDGYTCVITEWDTLCDLRTELMSEMTGNVFTCGDQPFYYVFVDDGSCRYAAQDNLILAPDPEWINHYEIGRYFYKFCGTHYLPNEEKRREYPEDDKVRDAILLAYQNGMEVEKV